MFDVVLVHGYWLSQKGDRASVELSTRGKLITYATYLLYKNNQAKNLVLPAGHIWGKKYPSISKLMAEELVKKYKVPKERIVIFENGLNTRSEIDFFLKTAKEKGWKNLADLAFAKHQWTIPVHYKNQAVVIARSGATKQSHIAFLKAEEIILQKGDSEHKKQLEDIGKSIFEFNFALYQVLVRLVQIFDPNYKFLGKIADKTRNKKSHNNPFSFLPIDKYDL